MQGWPAVEGLLSELLGAYTRVCSGTCGLSQQVATLPELSALCYTLGYLAVLHT